MNAKQVLGLCLWGALGVSVFPANATQIKIEVENKSAVGGVFFTPVWMGFHDGSFDTFDVGSAASPELERLAEDGNPAPLSAALGATQATAIGSVLTAPAGFPGAPVFDPGDVASAVFDLDVTMHQFFSYASMIIPSNDAFFGNANPLALFDAMGAFVGDMTIGIFGSNIYDAGTEDNTENDAAFLNQLAANTGDTTVGGVINQHPGFLPGGNILGGTNGAGVFFDPILADFARNNGLTEIAQIRITQVPEPGSLALLLIGSLGIGAAIRKRKARAEQLAA